MHFIININSSQNFEFAFDREVKYADAVSSDDGTPTLKRMNSKQEGEINVLFVVPKYIKNKDCNYPI